MASRNNQGDDAPDRGHARSAAGGAGQGGGADAADTLDAWAERYLDLWQRQLAAAAADPRVAELTARTVELMNAGVDALLTLAEAGGRTAKPDPFRSSAPSSATPEAGAAPAGAASRAAQPDVGELARRVARLEERIAGLESAARRPSGKKPAAGKRSTAKRSVGKRASRAGRGGKTPSA